MADIEIPDDFYIISNNLNRYLCHKSCIFVDGEFSNDRCLWISENIDKNSVNRLIYICDTYDKIEEFTYFVGGVFKKLNIFLLSSGIVIYDDSHIDFSFESFDEALQYLQKNHPECIKNDDIKIALKD